MLSSSARSRLAIFSATWVLVAACGDRGSGSGAQPVAVASSSGVSSAPAGGSSVTAPGTATVVPGATASSAGSSPCAEGRLLVPAGSFKMGSPPDDKDADADERPVREVRLKAYCIDRTEVTVAAYARCVAEPRNGVACSPASATVVSRSLSPDDVIFWSKFCNAGKKDAGDHPVNCLDWKQADTYCKWAGGRLPSEAEWEHAARGSDGRKYPWGEGAPAADKLNGCGSECAASGAALGRKDKKSMFQGDDGATATSPVGRYPAGASPFGALDMAGNVWEWTEDAYAPYDPAATDNPVGAGAPAAPHVVRGGHWLNANPLSPRAANRESRPPEKRLEDVGFRCASGA